MQTVRMPHILKKAKTVRLAVLLLDLQAARAACVQQSKHSYPSGYSVGAGRLSAKQKLQRSSPLSENLNHCELPKTEENVRGIHLA